MGYDAQCDIRFDGQTVRAKAVLEQKDLVLRGPLRLSIPLARISEATASDGWLRVSFDGRLAEIGLGPAAEKWAQRITNPPSRLAKLGVKEGIRILVLGAVEEAFVEELQAAGATVLRRMGRGTTPAFDVIFVAVERRESLDQLEALRSKIVSSGAIWTLRPKGQRAITEADTMAAGKRAGLVDVKVVSFSDTLTAEKFVIPVAKRPEASAAARQSTIRASERPKKTPPARAVNPAGKRTQ
jgi:hypothetical protein